MLFFSRNSLKAMTSNCLNQLKPFKNMITNKIKSAKKVKKTIKHLSILELVNKYKFKTKHPTNVLELLKKWR